MLVTFNILMCGRSWSLHSVGTLTEDKAVLDVAMAAADYWDKVSYVYI